MKENYLVVGVEEFKEFFSITYYAAESEDDYYNGNHDSISHWCINKSNMNDPTDIRELKEFIKLYDADFINKEVVIVGFLWEKENSN